MVYYSNSISIPRSLKSFMLNNCKVDFLGNSEVAFFLYTLYRTCKIKLNKIRPVLYVEFWSRRMQLRSDINNET
jgi:hypothetical protein